MATCHGVDHEPVRPNEFGSVDRAVEPRSTVAVSGTAHGGRHHGGDVDTADSDRHTAGVSLGTPPDQFPGGALADAVSMYGPRLGSHDSREGAVEGLEAVGTGRRRSPGGNRG